MDEKPCDRETYIYDIYIIYINEDECAFCVFIFFTCLKINRKQYYVKIRIYLERESHNKRRREVRGGIIEKSLKV